MKMLLKPLCTLILCLALFGQRADAQEAVAAPSSNDLHEFTRLLADERIQNWLTSQAQEAEEDAPSAAVPLRAQLEALITKTRVRIGDLGAAWRSLPETPTQISALWRAQVTAQLQVRSLTFVVIFLFLGAGLEWLVRQYTAPALRRIELTDFETPMRRLGGALTRAGLSLLALLLFAIGSIGAFAAFEWPPLLYTLIVNALVGIVAVRIFGTVLVLFLAPRVAGLRLIPVPDALAQSLRWILFTCFSVLIAALSLIDVFSRLAEPERGLSGAPQVLSVAVVLALLVLGVALVGIAFSFRMSDRAGLCGGKTKRRWRGYHFGLAGLLFLLWLFDMPRIMWSVALLGSLAPVLVLLRAWVDHAFDTANADFLAKIEPDPAPTSEDISDVDGEPVETIALLAPYDTYRPIMHRIVRFGVVVSCGLILAVIWGIGVFETTENPTILQSVSSILIDSAAALLIADLVWVWAKTAIDRRLDAYQPPEDGQAPGPEARMATLLPLLRVVLMLTLLTIVVMSILSSMGVNIAPILAGASVLGIAIGFGAQSLVKDVVSGIFFLVDDAFRIGEYIEVDQLRGTVEKISVRSLQIRHHRGAVHTLPFGELKSLTNHSRDWVIMKLEFRVPFDTDLKLVKKLIKQVGARLKENPDYGDGIIETLKSQGVRRMEEFNMVVGVKFMTRPGEQWLVRRDAYQGVRDIFDENGIRMAERNVKVEIGGGEHLSPDERKAAAAAAQEATQNQLPPGPIPDEP